MVFFPLAETFSVNCDVEYKLDKNMIGISYELPVKVFISFPRRRKLYHSNGANLILDIAQVLC